ncbi:MAG: hypothetical protein IT317_12465 [Anaerolineales bacterium]|nr:hypothetical protein [Anaerolineales bacterium]
MNRLSQAIVVTGIAVSLGITVACGGSTYSESTQEPRELTAIANDQKTQDIIATTAWAPIRASQGITAEPPGTPTPTGTATPAPTFSGDEESGTPGATRTRPPVPSATLIAPNAPADVPVMDSFSNKLVEADANHLIYTTDGFIEKFQPYFDEVMVQNGWEVAPEGYEQSGNNLRLEYRKENRTAVMTIEPASEAERWQITVTITEQ